MTPMRWVYAAFWIVVITMILLQFQNYNKHIDQAIAAAGPKQQHFYFLNGATNGASSLDAPPKPDAADVRQVSFSYTANSPIQGSFTCHVVLKNYGNLKATDIQVQVAPFRGTLAAVENDNDASPQPLPDSDPLAQDSQWVTLTDLAPDETKTVDAVFTNQPGHTPGDNLNPQIIFQTEKPAAAPAPAH